MANKPDTYSASPPKGRMHFFWRACFVLVSLAGVYATTLTFVAMIIVPDFQYETEEGSMRHFFLNPEFLTNLGISYLLLGGLIIAVMGLGEFIWTWIKGRGDEAAKSGRPKDRARKKKARRHPYLKDKSDHI